MKFVTYTDIFSMIALERTDLRDKVLITDFLHICENKDTDQLCCNGEADQRLCFRYICVDGTIPLLPKSEISSL